MKFLKLCLKKNKFISKGSLIWKIFANLWKEDCKVLYDNTSAAEIKFYQASVRKKLFNLIIDVM